MTDAFNAIKIYVIFQTFAPLISILIPIDIIKYLQSASTCDNDSMYVLISFTFTSGFYTLFLCTTLNGWLSLDGTDFSFHMNVLMRE